MWNSQHTRECEENKNTMLINNGTMEEPTQPRKKHIVKKQISKRSTRATQFNPFPATSDYVQHP